MATITGLTAERMLEIEGATVIGGKIENNHLILTKFDGTEVDAGTLPPGPQGPVGPAGGLIPGELRMWPGAVLPSAAEFGKWVWADGGVYDVATYPKAAANIAAQWRTFGGASDPGGANFRVPDLRGLVPVGMDSMPGGARANRMTRSVAITIAGRTGEETHVITIGEMPAHNHPLNTAAHTHVMNFGQGESLGGPYPNIGGLNPSSDTKLSAYSTAPGGGATSVANSGGNGAHENVQPSVFIPYIVKLDD